MSPVRVFDRQVVQPELLLHRAQHVLFGLIEAEPHELVIVSQRRPNLIDAKVGHPRAATVGGAVDHRGRCWRRRRDENVCHVLSLRQLRPVNSRSNPLDALDSRPGDAQDAP